MEVRCKASGDAIDLSIERCTNEPLLYLTCLPFEVGCVDIVMDRKDVDRLIKALESMRGEM